MTEAEKTDMISRLHDLLRENPDVIFLWEDLYSEMGISKDEEAGFRSILRRGIETLSIPWARITTSRGRPTGDVAGVVYVPDVKTVRELYDLVSRVPKKTVPVATIQHMLLGLMGELG